MIKTKILKAFVFLLILFSSIFMCDTKKVYALDNYGGYDRGYSDWSDQATGNPGEVQRIVYRYADALFATGCNVHNTNYETYDVEAYYNNVRNVTRKTLYQTCKWDPYNCRRDWCAREDWVNGPNGRDEIYQYDCYGDHDGESLWDCTRAGLECPSGSNGCLRWNEKVCVDSRTTWDGACGLINDGHNSFLGWSGWSNWSTTEYFDSNSRKVEWKYQYSYPYPPVLGLKSNWYFVGQTISALELKQNALATDIIDGLISSNVNVSRIKYADGTIVDNPSELDTSKEQTFILTCNVTNSRGLITIASKEYHIYDLNAHNDPNVVNPEDYTNVDIYDRFVSDEYLDTIHTKSIWQIDTGYQVALRNALSKDEGQHSPLN